MPELFLVFNDYKTIVNNYYNGMHLLKVTLLWSIVSHAIKANPIK